MNVQLAVLGLLGGSMAVGCLCGAPGGGGGDGDDDGDYDPDVCSDQDGDRHGAGPGCQGPDCDETDPFTHAGCGENCDVEPIAIDCPCASSAEPVVCWMGGFGAEPGVGLCQAGLRPCIDGFWGGCEGQVLPAEEICDGLDNDCDGQDDEGVLGEDGTCPNVGDRTGVGPEHGVDFCDEEGVCDGVEETPEGWLTLGSSTLSLLHIWIANSIENTVSKLDTRTGEEVGRFYTGLDATNSDPSRTAVGLDGSVYVANRAFYPPGGGPAAQASVTKIAADEADCVDRDGDGRIATSTDSTQLPWDTDECVLWTTEIGEPGCGARAIAIGVEDGLDGVRFERVYVGCFYERRVYRVDGESGDVLSSFETPRVSPYGFAITGDNVMFVAGLGAAYEGGSDEVAIVDLGEDPPSVEYSAPPTCTLGGGYGYGWYEPEGVCTYGIAADDEGRLWSCNVWYGCLYRYDPDAGRWDSVQSDHCRGVAVDGEGFVWTAYETTAERRDPDSMRLLSSVETTGQGGLGVGVDFGGHIWVVNQATNDASKIDPDTEREVGRYPVGAGPYTYSDMTGFQLRNVTAPSGRYRRVLEVCDGPTDWSSITIDRDTPPGTSIGVRARSADTEEELAAAPWLDFGAVDAGTGDTIFFDGLPDGRYLEVELELRRGEDAAAAPILRGFSISGECMPVLE